MPFDPKSDAADAAIIGAGAAGLLAGIAAARAGARAVVYERMPAPGRKLAIAGGGRCNFTNTLSTRDFVRRFGDKNAPKLGHALREFSNDDLIALLARRGVEGQVEHGFRIFTKSGRGGDVVRALAQELEEAGGLLECEARINAVKSIPRQEPATGGTLASRFFLEGDFSGSVERREARAVVICTGGLSYPATGSSGDGYAWARALRHTVTPLRAALVGLAIEEGWATALQGLSWEDAEVRLRAMALPLPPPARGRGREPASLLSTERGEILFTHFGISGPAILDLSNVFVASGLSRAVLEVDFFPELPRVELDKQLLACSKQFPNRTLVNALQGSFRKVPVRLLERWQEALGPPGAAPLCRLPKGARLDLAGLMKQSRLTVTGTRGVEHGEVTAGGVAWEEINPATLESRLCPGLFFAGEILDVAGRCGGFNLQAAFSTGFLAGRSAAGRAASTEY